MLPVWVDFNGAVNLRSTTQRLEETQTKDPWKIKQYTGVLAAADVFTASTTFWVMESIRLDLGYGSQVHP